MTPKLFSSRTLRLKVGINPFDSEVLRCLLAYMYESIGKQVFTGYGLWLLEPYREIGVENRVANSIVCSIGLDDHLILRGDLNPNSLASNRKAESSGYISIDPGLLYDIF